MKLSDTAKEQEKFKIMAEYYLKELNESRKQYSELLQIFAKTNQELENFKDPSIENSNTQSIQILKLNLKIEGLDLINKQLNQSVADSKRVITAIEQTCIRQIEKVENVIKANAQMLVHGFSLNGASVKDKSSKLGV
jgi:DNA-directed RNA polymerase alpha subunit